MRKKKLAAWLLTALMLPNLFATPALAASEDTTATAMTLEDTQGSVTVLNAKVKKVTLRDGARLYKGYSVTTAEGYAWIGLDDTKAIKLDWDTEITLKKSGKKLEIMLESGTLFFNVSKPLEKDESLSIRTSNMYTGIRGTSGVLSTETVPVSDTGTDDGDSGSSGEVLTVSTLTMFDGRAETTNPAPENPAQLETTIVEAGWQSQVSALTNPETPGTPQEVESTLTPIFVQQALAQLPVAAVEVAKDPQLQARVAETAAAQQAQAALDPTQAPPAPAAPLPTLEAVLAQADSNLKQQETQKQEANTAAQAAVAAVTEQHVAASEPVEQVDQVFTSPEPTTESSSSGSDEPAVRFYPVTYYAFDYTADYATYAFAEIMVESGDMAPTPYLVPSDSPGDWALAVFDEDSGQYVPAPGNGELGYTPYDFSAPVTADVNLIYVNTTGMG